jgi:hypothetical protein
MAFRMLVSEWKNEASECHAVHPVVIARNRLRKSLAEAIV